MFVKNNRMKKHMNEIYFAKRNAWRKTKPEPAEYHPEKWEQPAKIVSWIVLIVILILSFSK